MDSWWRTFLVLMVTLAPCLGRCGQLSAQEQPSAVELQTQNSDTPSGQTSASAGDDGGWHFGLSPYLWFAGAHGTVGARGRAASMHASLGDLLSHVDIGLMGAAELRRKRLVLTGDMLWIRLSDSRALPALSALGLGAVSADVRVGQFVWTSKGGYRLMDRKKFKADATVGVRYWHLGQKLTFNPSLPGLNFNGSQSWADILVGGRVQLPVGKRTVIDLLGDAGGWNASAKLDYQFAALLAYKLSPKWTVGAGYRYLFVDYRPTNLSVNVATSGALLGVTYNFK